ncbi:Serine/threonine-protein kinase RIO1 [Cichlidogyrus casuarinus]|uniref:Serine/threonine-protein kinase RIO1 n=1 Tax=Cichlidogyrus casuarinus TaxID=1844966 RepID=A0ABD2QE70_9PLAT
MDISSDYDDYLEEFDDLELADGPIADSNREMFMKFSQKVDFTTKNGYRIKDKSNRATTDHALDARSKTIIFRMMSQEIFDEINGCISTGKEANVYHAISKSAGNLALKVYMTSIMPFKSRDKYVAGDFRMRKHYNTSSSFKFVSKWAEKEYRNLKRITQTGLIKCPEPLKLKGVVLLMSFVGKDAVPAPKLKDAASFCCEPEDSPNWPALYCETLLYMRVLYQKCRLVHGDLSEYNMLYLDGHVWIIDVSQAVEHEAPKALEYLRTDCHNVNSFFRKMGVCTLTLRELFEWIVDPSLYEPGTPDCDRHLEKLLFIATARGHNATIEEEDTAFRLVNIPRNLSSVTNFVRDLVHLQRGKLEEKDIYYAAVAGMRSDLKGVKDQPKLITSSNSSICSSDEDDSGSLQESPTTHNKNQPISGPRPKNETLAEKKERKKSIRDAKAAKRLTKIPKAVKKSAVKAK